jgi:hypothetical protein
LAWIECSGTSNRCVKQVESWQRSELTDVNAKVVIDEAFVEGKLEAAETPCPHGDRLENRRNQLRATRSSADSVFAA